MSLYTHVGAKPNVAYQCRGRLYGHSSPVAGRRHALNAEYIQWIGHRYIALCGEKVAREYESECGQHTIRNHVQPAGAATVTCKRCLAKIRRAQSSEEIPLNDLTFLRRVVGHRPTRTNARTAVELLECGHSGATVGRLGKYDGRAFDSPTHRNCAACREQARQEQAPYPCSTKETTLSAQATTPQTIDDLKATALARRAADKARFDAAHLATLALARDRWEDVLAQFRSDYLMLSPYVHDEPPGKLLEACETYPDADSITVPVIVRVPEHEAIVTEYTWYRGGSAPIQDQRKRWKTICRFTPATEEPYCEAFRDAEADDAGDILLLAAEGYQSQQEATIEGLRWADAYRARKETRAVGESPDDRLLAALRTWLAANVRE